MPATNFTNSIKSRQQLRDLQGLRRGRSGRRVSLANESDETPDHKPSPETESPRIPRREHDTTDHDAGEHGGGGHAIFSDA